MLVQKMVAVVQFVGVEVVFGFVMFLGVGEKGLCNYLKLLKEVGGIVDKVVKMQMDNFKGLFEQFMFVFDGFGIVIGNEFLFIF